MEEEIGSFSLPLNKFASNLNDCNSINMKLVWIMLKNESWTLCITSGLETISALIPYFQNLIRD